MIKFTEIIEKLKDIISNEHGEKRISDKDIAYALEIEYNKFRKQKSRNSVPYYEIMAFLAKKNISINWFFFNQLPESLIEETSNYIILKYRKSVITSAGGGAINYELDSTPLVLDKQLLDHINCSYKYTEVLKVFGESMEPDIKDGSLVFVDKSKVSLNSAGVYLVSLNDGLFIKRIQLKNNKVILISKNQIFKDIILHLDEVTVIGKVLGVLIHVK